MSLLFVCFLLISTRATTNSNLFTNSLQLRAQYSIPEATLSNHVVELRARVRRLFVVYHQFCVEESKIPLSLPPEVLEEVIVNASAFGRGINGVAIGKDMTAEEARLKILFTSVGAGGTAR